MITAWLINQRWVDIPEDAIFDQLVKVGLNNWRIEEQPGKYTRHYLFGGNYAYPYSLPIEVVGRLAARLNEVTHMGWYQDYNQQAINHFDHHGMAINQAAEYWAEIGNVFLPQPQIMPVDGLANGDEYIAIIGLFHLTGEQNGNNHHLFIDLIDLTGNRIYDHTPPLHLYYGWEGMTTDQEQTTDPIRIDKPAWEPGANLGLTWGQVIYGFHINNIATDRFRGVHIRYEDDGEGNDRGHHSHYIVLQKRIYKSATPPDPDPPDPPATETVMTIKKSWLDEQPVGDDGYIRIKV